MYIIIIINRSTDLILISNLISFSWPVPSKNINLATGSLSKTISISRPNPFPKNIYPATDSFKSYINLVTQSH